MHHPTDRIAHTTAFVTPVVEHWLEREIAEWVHPMKDRSDDTLHHERTLLPRKEGNILFNDALNTFYLRLYGVGSYHGFLRYVITDLAPNLLPPISKLKLGTHLSYEKTNDWSVTKSVFGLRE